MKNILLFLAAAFTLTTVRVSAQEAPSFVKQVRPFLGKYCSECHNSRVHKGGLNLDSHASLLVGSDNGAVVEAGRPEKSSLVLSVEGKGSSLMPPKKASRHPKTDEIAVLRNWVKAGAKDDTGTTKIELPAQTARHGLNAPVTGLAFQDRTLWLARGKEILRVDTEFEMPVVLAHRESALVSALAIDATTKRLALAFGQSGASSTLALRSLVNSKQGDPAVWQRPAHADSVLALAFDRAGKVLASASYDTRIQISEAATGRPLHTLKDHSDAVYALAFNPEGSQLASVSADRAVKVWDVAKGKLLTTLSEATDWLYAVAWSPNGEYLAAGGVDKSIRLYKVQPTGIKILHSVFGHESAVQKLVFSADSTTLYSLGEDRVAKAWSTKTMQETRIFPTQSEAVLSMALSADQKVLALGRFDGVVTLFDTGTGAPLREISSKKSATSQRGSTPTLRQVAVVGAKAKLTKIEPREIVRGGSVELSLEGTDLADAGTLVTNIPLAKVEAIGKDQTKLKWRITTPAGTPPGKYTVQWKQGDQSTDPLPIMVDAFGRHVEREAGQSPRFGESVKLPVSIVGKLDRASDHDFYRFEAQPGQQLGVHILTQAIGSKAEAVLELTDSEGRTIVESERGFLGHTFAKAGTYALGVRDRELRGGTEFFYRLHLGELPVVTSTFPLGALAGETVRVQVRGVFLNAPSTAVSIPKDAKPGTTVAIPVTSKWGTPLGASQLVVGEGTESLDPKAPLPSQGTANGEISQPGKADVWTFHAKKGQRRIVETHARRLGSNLDSILEILDHQGLPVPRALLRCGAKTYIAFRDHDNVSAGIRIEAWNDLASNDLILIGNELMKIQALPSHPDADCIFFSSSGQRLGFLDTTPSHHAMGSTLYKVSVHPPSTKFPPNGFPVFPLFYRNDDGGPGYGQDSRIVFDPPADGVYRVKISDARGMGGENFGYRLTLREPRPNFAVRFSPTNPKVSRGGAIPLTLTAERFDGFEGPIHLSFSDLPAGLSIPDTKIEAHTFTTSVSLYAEVDAKSPPSAVPLKLVARADSTGKQLVNIFTGESPQVIEPGDLVTSTEESAIEIRPGGQAKMTVRIERRNGFEGRVPLEVKGLPHGVRVIDIGLNGILINANETRRVVVIEAEPWVQPNAMPFVVLSRREGKNTEHAAKAVTLKVQ